MEVDSGTAGQGSQGGKVGGSLGRTQSSLELLSNTALGFQEEAASKSRKGTEAQHEEREESFSAGSGETTESARVTPSVSQGSIAAAMATAAATSSPQGSRGIAHADSRSQLQPEQDPSSNGGAQSMTASGMVIMPPHHQGYIPTSPHYPHTPGGGDPTGLPIDHYSNGTSSFYAGPPHGAILSHLQQPTFLPPESYYAPPPHYYTASASTGGVHAPPANLITLAPPQALQNSLTGPAAAPSPFPSQGRLNTTTHAAFIPPRSSNSIRVSSSSMDGSVSPRTSQYAPYVPSHTAFSYVAAPTAGAPPQQQETVQQPVNGGNTESKLKKTASRSSVLLDPCASFQSDSTSSLISEKGQKSKVQKVIDKQTNGWNSSKDSETANKDPLAETRAENKLLKDRNAELQQELEKRDQEIAVLRGEVRELDMKVKELRQFPAGKISQIPMADMLEIMQIYGSEVSDTVMPPRKMNIQKASVIRQFRRWNPNFLKYFHFKDGKWHPKLGMEGELERRKSTRKKASKGGKQQLSTSSSTDELSPRQEQQPGYCLPGSRLDGESTKLGESSENEDSISWTIHNNHSTTSASDIAKATTNNTANTLESSSDNKTMLLLSSPGENRKRKFEMQTSHGNINKKD